MEDLETVFPAACRSRPSSRPRQGRPHHGAPARGWPRDRAVDLVRNLEHSRRFLLPRIVGENAESKERPDQRLEPVSASNRVNFDLLADYKPGTPGRAQASPAARNPTANHTRTASASAPIATTEQVPHRGRRLPIPAWPRPPCPRCTPQQEARNEHQPPSTRARAAGFSAHLALCRASPCCSCS